MLKKFIKIIVVLFVVVVILVLVIVYFANKNTIKIQENVAIINYHKDGKNISQPLKQEEAEQVKRILNNRRSYKDNPACGFSEYVSISFGETKFCIACDSCAVIWIYNTDRYISISDDEKQIIETIFTSYGGTIAMWE